jgi:hypothetical protein
VGPPEPTWRPFTLWDGAPLACGRGAKGSRPMAQLTDRTSASVPGIGGVGHPAESNGIVFEEA